MKHRIASLFLTLVLCMGLAAPVWAASTVTVKVDLEVDYSAAYEALEELNALRREAGIGELVMDAAMMEMALQRAAECTISFSHTRPDGQGFDTARPSGTTYEKQDMAENILRDPGGNATPAAVTQSWYDSPGHYTNMMNEKYASVGIACVRDRAGHAYWVQNFTAAAGTPEATPSSGQESFFFSIETAEQYIDLRLSETKLHLETGEKAIVYVCNGETPVVPDIIRTSDESVASLSMENGGVCVSAIGAGTATLTLGFSGYSAEVTVTVEQGIGLEGLALANLEGGYSVEVGENLYTTVYFRPQGAPEYPIVWEIDDPSVATISGSGNSCKITGVSPGTAVLIAKTAEPVNGEIFSAMAIITVFDETTGTEPTDINLSAYYVELMPTEEVRILSYVQPGTAPQDVTWRSEDPSVAMVDQNGRVTAVADGYANIYVESRTGEASAQCRVNVTSSFLGKPLYYSDVKEDDFFYDAVAWATCQQLEGYGMDVFGPLDVDKGCTRQEIVEYLWKLSGSPQPADIDNNPFTDISDSISNRDARWAVQWAVETGVTSGTSATTFSPNDTVTRAQAVTFLYRLAGMPSVAGSAGFDDVPAGDWFADAAVWAVKEGITKGTSDTTFTPDQECTRGEILTFLYRQFS